MKNEFLDYLSDEDDSYYFVGDDDLEVTEGNQNTQATATLSDMEFDDDDLDPSLRESDPDDFDLVRAPHFFNFFDEFDFFVTPFYFDISEYSLTHIYYFASLNSFFLFNFLLKKPKFRLFGTLKFSILELLFYFKFFLKSFASLFDVFYRARFWNIGYCYSMSINMVIYSFFLPQFYFLNLFPSAQFVNNFFQRKSNNNEKNLILYEKNYPLEFKKKEKKELNVGSFYFSFLTLIREFVALTRFRLPFLRQNFLDGLFYQSYFFNYFFNYLKESFQIDLGLFILFFSFRHDFLYYKDFLYLFISMLFKKH